MVRIALLVPFLALGLVFAAPAHATWRLYASGDFGYSIAKYKVRGGAEVGLAQREPFSGRDNDVSPEVGGAFGVEIPMFELTPWELPRDMRLPDWPVRFEIEASGLREFRPATEGLIGGREADYHTKVETWMLMQNAWLDIPLRGLYRPIRATSEFIFNQPRLPGVKRFLEPLSVYTGVGIGLGGVRAKTSDSDYSGKKKKYDFAYQFGTGFGWQLTEHINLGMGYRFIKLAKLKGDLEDNANNPGRVRISSDIHEVRFQVRVRVFDLPYPWR
ncbi:MAG: porin family protein [bacterium]|nr:porin family protein [bacterium]